MGHGNYSPKPNQYASLLIYAYKLTEMPSGDPNPANPTSSGVCKDEGTRGFGIKG